MPASTDREPDSQLIPSGQVRLKGSERSLGPRSTRIAAAAPSMMIEFTVVLRRRTDGPALPDAAYWATTHPVDRTYLSVDEFGQAHGALPEELVRVTQFIEGGGMTVLEASVPRRTVRVHATAAQINRVFGIELCEYRTVTGARQKRGLTPGSAPEEDSVQQHLSYEGYVHLPAAIGECVVAVFGLNDFKHAGRNIDPEPVTLMTVPQVCQLYGWSPLPTISGQTIGIIGTALSPSDVTLYYENLNKSVYIGGYYVPGTQPGPIPLDPVPPGAVAGQYQVPSISYLGSNGGASDGEVNMDISIASTVAQGAAIAVYFYDLTFQSLYSAFNQAIKPTGSEPDPCVISCSYSICPNGDGVDVLGQQMVTPSEIVAMSELMQDAAVRGVTVCVASGDQGVYDGLEQGDYCVAYMASDPGVLAVGATTIGAINGSQFEEYLWDDIYDPAFAWFGATGGGVSAFFNSNNIGYPQCRQPSYQSAAGIPSRMNDGSVGRGVPDVAANGGSSGYYVYTDGVIAGQTGTSASTPLVAGLIAQLNAATGARAGWLNPVLYATGGSLCRKVVSNPEANAAGNSLLGFGFDDAIDVYQQGYLGTTQGWDACTGWGVFDWPALQKFFSPKRKLWIADHKSIREWFPPFGSSRAGGGSGWPWLIPPYVPAEDPEDGRQGGEAGDKKQAVEGHAFIRPEERPAVGPDASGADPSEKKSSA